jgi:hypothetical protein
MRRITLENDEKFVTYVGFKEREHLIDVGVDERIILNWSLRK